MHSPHLRNGDLCHTSLRAEYLHNLIFCRGGVLLSICLFIQSSVSVRTLEYFSTLGYVPVLCCLFCCSNCQIRRSFSWVLYPFDIPHILTYNNYYFFHPFCFKKYYMLIMLTLGNGPLQLSTLLSQPLVILNSFHIKNYACCLSWI